MKRFFIFLTVTFILVMSFVVIPVYADEVATTTEAIADVGIKSQIGDFVNKWLPIIIHALAGLGGSVVVLIVAFRKVRNLVKNLKDAGEQSNQELELAKKQYEEAKKDFKEQLEEATKTLNSANKTIVELSDQLDASTNSNNLMVGAIEVMFNEVPQFVANGGADRIREIVEQQRQKTEQKVKAIEEGTVEENEVK